MQLAGIDDLHIEKKGAIDLVTQIDREVERMFRALISERVPHHALLAHVAAGRFDGFWEVGLSPCDVSAGALLIEEAGGQVSSLCGGHFESRQGEVIAPNGRIHAQMVEVMRSRKRTDWPVLETALRGQ